MTASPPLAENRPTTNGVRLGLYRHAEFACRHIARDDGERAFVQEGIVQSHGGLRQEDEQECENELINHGTHTFCWPPSSMTRAYPLGAGQQLAVRFGGPTQSAPVAGQRAWPQPNECAQPHHHERCDQGESGCPGCGRHAATEIEHEADRKRPHESADVNRAWNGLRASHRVARDQRCRLCRR